MKTRQGQLDYRPASPVGDRVQATRATTEPVSVTNAAVGWSIRGCYLTGWAIVGIFVWIPRLLGAVLLFGIALTQAALRGTSAERAGRHLRRAADFYRSFVTAMESVRAPGEPGPTEGEDRSVGLWPILREMAWAMLVWYVILWPAGAVHPTPADLASSLAAAPWGNMWSGAVEAVTSIPGLFRG